MATPTTPTAADPTAEIPAVTPSFSQLLILLVIGLAGLFVVAVMVIGGVYWVVNSGGGSDRPAIVSADDAAEMSMREYAASLADLYAMAAEGIERGDIKSDVQLLEYTQPTKESWRKSFESFDAASDQAIADGEWRGRDIDEAKAFCESASEGFRRLAE